MTTGPGGGGVVLSCEHASNAVPREVSLGVSAAVLASHVAWDPGALPLALALAQRLAAPLHAGRLSRLVVDLHRRETHPDVVPAVAFGTPVPGNAGLSPDRREARLRRWHRPWRAALAAEVRGAVAGGGCVHLSVHSFDPSLAPDRTDLDVGVLFDPARPEETAVAGALLAALQRGGLSCAANRPYEGVAEGTTTWLREQHPAAYQGLELELSQGLGPAGRQEVLRRVAVVLGAHRWRRG